MAEGFANHYGADVLTATSAGLAPIPQIPADTIRAMAELNVDVTTHVPRRYDPLEVLEYDLVVNMSGFRLPGPRPKQVVEWDVKDPYGAPIDVYRVTRGDLEQRVMRLILELRKRLKLAV
jgi:arsenate reductase (thioredoxin)